MLRNRSLGATVGLGFASLLVMLAAIIALAIREVDVAQGQRQELAVALEAAEVADRLALSVARSDAALRDFVLSRLPADRAQAQRLRESAEAAAVVLRRAPPDDLESRQLIDQVIAAAEAWDQQAATTGALAGNLRPEGAASFQDQYIKSAAVEVYRTVDLLREHLTGRVSELRQEIGERGDRLTQSLVVGFGVAGLVGIFLGVYFVRLVTDPVARLVELADAVRAGDYTTARHLIGAADRQELGASGNEIDHLTATFSEMTDTLEERETRLRTQASNLARINQRLAALQSLTDAALSELPFEERLQQLLQRVLTGVSGSAGVIFLRHLPTGRLEPRIMQDPAAGGLAGVPTAEAAAFAEAVAGRGEELLVADPDQNPYHDHPFFGSRPVGTFWALPVRINDQVVGIGYVEFREPGEFEPSQLHLLQVFAERLERAVDRARSEEAMAAWQRELQRRLEQQKDQLLRTERLAAIGLVGGSIAHELRNPLGVISNSVYFLTHRSAAFDEKARRHLEIITAEVAHAKLIINNLVDFSTSIEPMATRLNLNGLIRMALESVQVPPGISVDLELASPLPPLLGDESQLVQVYEHLIRNAVQAMEGDGRLFIGTAASNSHLTSTIRDTGPGIPPEQQQRIFEPLVSSRAKGMGLGLTLARRIVEAHGGELHLESEPGQGATFHVTLPTTAHLLVAGGDSEGQPVGVSADSTES